MTVQSQARRNDYTATGSAIFFFTFRILDSTHLAVYVNDVLQTLSTHYSLSGVGNSAGGTVTFTTAPASGSAVAFIRNVPITQLSDYVNNDDLPAETLESDFDKGAMIDQQLQEQLDRALLFPAGSTETGITIPELSCGKYLRVNSTGDGLEWVALTATGTYVDPLTTQGDLIRAGSTGSGVGERLALGNAGDGLVVDNTTGKPEWKPGSVAALTNRTGAAHTLGDVVALDTGSNLSVAASNVQASLKTFVVALGTNADGVQGLYCRSGACPTIKAAGTITRGHYIRKSATAFAVEDAGVLMNGVTEPPAGSLGVATSDSGAGLVTAYLFGVTLARPVPVYPSFITGLLIANNATDPTNDIDVAVGAASSDDTTLTDRVMMVLSTALTKQLDVAWGAGNGGGRFPGATVDGIWHGFLIQSTATGAVDFGWDTSASGANVPAGYDKKRRIKGLFRSGGINRSFIDYGTDIMLTTPVLQLDNGNPGSSRNLVTLDVPSCSRTKVFLNVELFNNVTSNLRVYIESPEATDQAPSATVSPLTTIISPSAVASNASAQVGVWTNTSGQIAYRTNSSGAGDVVRMALLGWSEPVV